MEGTGFPILYITHFVQAYGINLAFLISVNHTNKHAPIPSDFTDRVRVRLNNSKSSIIHEAQHENQFGYASELFEPKWSVPARFAVFTLGLLGLAMSTRTKGNLQKGFGLFGMVSLIRATTNLHITDLIGWIANPSVQLRRKLRVKAPIDDVYDFLSHFTNYSKFMSNIKQVEVNELGGLRWTVQGPAGILFHWNTALGKMIRNQAISWKSSVNSLIRNSGNIQLIDLPGEGTEILIELTYAPPVGALGYAVVHFLGFDPKDKIDEDLQVLKDLIEENFSSNLEPFEFRHA